MISAEGITNPSTDPDQKLKAIFKENTNGTFTVSTKGVCEVVLQGNDFKDAMSKLVRTVAALKKASKVPAAFELRGGLELFFE